MSRLIIVSLLFVVSLKSFGITLKGDFSKQTLTDIFIQLEHGVNLYEDGFFVGKGTPILKELVSEIVNDAGYFKVIYNKHENGYDYLTAKYVCPDAVCKLQFNEQGSFRSR